VARGGKRPGAGRPRKDGAKQSSENAAKEIKEPAKPQLLQPIQRGELNHRQWLFVREYLVDLNGTRAAIRAGYSEASAHVTAHELLKNPKIANAIDAALAESPGITRARIVDELSKIAFSNAGEFFEWGPDGVKVKDSATLNEDQKSIISEVSHTVTPGGGTIRVKLHDKQVALEKLGRAVRLFAERMEITGKDGGPIQMAEVDPLDEIRCRIASIAARLGAGEDPAKSE
jgi:phage terminase small subunit